MKGGFGPRDAWADHAAGRAVGQVRERDSLVPKKPRKKPGEEEHQIQSGFIELVRIKQNQIPELKLLYAIPNGGHRHPAVAAKLKAEGVIPGPPDLHLPVARGPWHSLYLETKRPGGTQSGAQKEFAWMLLKQGNLVKVCDSVDKLWAAVSNYLALPAPESTETRAA